MNLGFESNIIAPSKLDVDVSIISNMLWIGNFRKGFPKKKFDGNEATGKYCLIEGTFTTKEKGHLGSYAGAITNIERFEVWSDPDKKVR